MGAGVNGRPDRTRRTRKTTRNRTPGQTRPGDEGTPGQTRPDEEETATRERTTRETERERPGTTTRGRAPGTTEKERPDRGGITPDGEETGTEMGMGTTG